MNTQQPARCAIYTRKSSENGLEQSFNSLDAQREACEAYIKSQAHEGWKLRPTHYDDGGLSGGNMDRPALNQLISDIKNGLIDIVVVYKVDRLSRSLADFARLVELFEQHEVSFVSVTQHFNTSSSMGRLTLNVLLSFAQFEREVTGERIRDKIAASKKKGMWMGGLIPLGYDVIDKQMIPNKAEAKTVEHIYQRYLDLGCVRRLKGELDRDGYVSKVQKNGAGGNSFSRGALYGLLRNPIYIGKVSHKGKMYPGQHDAILDEQLWNDVQGQLERNRSKAKARSAAKAPSLLAGLLFDSNGNPMSPTHATKGKKRYRYYISQAVLKFESQKEGNVQRVPAEGVELVVTGQLKAFLNDPDRLLEAYAYLELAAYQQQHLIDIAKHYAKTWGQLAPHNQIKDINEIVEKIKLNQQIIHIHVRLSALISLLNPEHDFNTTAMSHKQHYVIDCPTQIKRCGIETRLVIGNKSTEQPHPESAKAIQKALRRALEWNQVLLDGKAKTLTELAEKEGVAQRYICDLIKLAYLAPELVGAILEGKIPAGLTLDKLKNVLSMGYEEQRQSLQFPI